MTELRATGFSINGMKTPVFSVTGCQVGMRAVAGAGLYQVINHMRVQRQKEYLFDYFHDTIGNRIKLE